MEADNKSRLLKNEWLDELPAAEASKTESNRIIYKHTEMASSSSSASSSRKMKSKREEDRELDQDLAPEELEYEDPYGDEYDSEDFVFEGVRGADGEEVLEELANPPTLEVCLFVCLLFSV
jgi:hypothetical protein